LICLLQLIDACDRAETTVVIPYFGYARQDKCFKSGEAVSARMIARMIHADRVCTVNIHNRDVLKYFDFECRDLDATPLIADHIKSTGLEDPMIIAPDEGALELIRSVAGTEFDHDMLKKKRISGEEVEIEEKEIDVKDRDVIILDDIISTGGTIVETVELLKRQKLRSIYVCCIHPVFAGNAEIKLFNAGVNEIFATDTIEHIFSKISVAPIIAMELG
jgi:ribose-phosphate pyrophosphokinase